MRNLKLSALLAAVGVLTVAGVGSSNPPKQGVVKMQDFDRKTDVIVGYAAGTEISPGFFHRMENTVHLPGIGGPNWPPNPCNAHISIYNKILSQVPEGNARLNAVTSQINFMARAGCNADIARDGTVNETQESAAVYTFRPLGY